MRIDTNNARTRILKAAAHTFAEKSFDGARVDEIAKQAGVPKSLIYYHFKSKDEILEVLTREFLDDYGAIVNTYRSESNRMDAASMNQRMREVYYQFGKDHEDLVRTIMMDSIKQGNHNTVLFQMIRELLPEQDNLKEEDKAHLLNEFFFNVIPCIAYICFRNGWIPFFQMDPASFDETFLHTYTTTHLQYHKHKMEVNDDVK